MRKTVIILSVLALITGCCGQATEKQILNTENTMNTEKLDVIGHWKTHVVIGMELLGKSTITDEYELLRIQEEELQGGHFFGWHTKFKDDGSFESCYNSWCGNDNRFNVVGTYEYTEANHIRIFVNTIIAFFCYGGGNSGTFELNGEELGVFLIDSIADGFRLVRCMDGETNQQRIACSDILRNLPRITARNWNNFKWIKLDPHNRDTDNRKILNKGLSAVGGYTPDKAKLLLSRPLDGEIFAFVFRYEEQVLVALYSAGGEVFAVYNPAQPLVELEIDEDEDYG
jgi:hypothetical protein